MWDVTAENRRREIPRSLARATRSESTQEEKVLRAEDGKFYKLSISLFHSTPKVTQGTYPSPGMPGPLWSNLSFSSLPLATKLPTFYTVDLKRIHSPNTKLFHIWAKNVTPSPCVFEKLPLIQLVLASICSTKSFPSSTLGSGTPSHLGKLLILDMLRWWETL